MNQQIWSQIENMNPWWSKGYTNSSLFGRKKYTKHLVDVAATHIDILIGARRVGKTSIIKQVILDLIKQVDHRKVIYITAELPVLSSVSILEIIDEFRQKFGISLKDQIFVCLDEVQDMKDWQIQVKYLYDNFKIKIYLTGSSGLVLNTQTSKLTGRFKITHVFPLSYSEYLDFESIISKKKNVASIDTVKAYLQMGGYPEYVVKKDAELLIQTVESTLYRDLLSIYGIRNPAILKEVLQVLCDKITTPVGASTIAKNLNISVETVQFYLKYLEDVYLVYPLFRYGRSHKVVKGSLPKYYLNDTGVLKLFSRTPRIGHMAENAVFIKLLQESKFEKPNLYYDVRDDVEVDFVSDNGMYEVKMKSLEGALSDDITYIVDTVDPNLDARQVSLWKFLM